MISGPPIFHAVGVSLSPVVDVYTRSTFIVLTPVMYLRRDASEIAISHCKNLLRPSAAIDRMASIAVDKVPHAPIYDSVCAPSPQQHVRHDIRQVSLVRTSHPFPRGVAPIVSVGRDSSHPHLHSEPRQNEFLPEPPDGNVLQHLVSVRV